MNIPENFDIKKYTFDRKKLNSIDKYILTKLENCIKTITRFMDKYEYGLASNVLYNFVYDDFCSFYLEMTKVTLQNEHSDKEGTYFTLLTALKAILMMIYPFSPFISEEIYLSLPEHKESIMLESYPEYNKDFVFKNVVSKVDLVKTIIEKIREYKVQNSLAPNHQLDIIINTNEKIEDFSAYLIRFSFAKSLKFDNKYNGSTSNIILPKATIYIQDNIDKDAIFKKLNEEKQKLENEIKRSEQMLNNKNFIAKAPKEKVAIEEEKYKNYKEQYQEVIKKIEQIR